MTPLQLILVAVASLFCLALIGAGAGRAPLTSRIVYGGALLACVAAAAAAAASLLRGLSVAQDLVLPLGLPWIGAHLRLDALAAFFALVINLGAALASLYALGYGRHEPDPPRVLPFFAIFVAAMNLVLVAADAFSFLVAWEFMSLASWALVMAHHQNEENRRAGLIYLIMASFGTLSLLLAFGLLAGPDGDYGFEVMRATHQGRAFAAPILALALLGAGSKAGLVPLHVWLPLAHPAAPSHVSALMSGVMTKVAVYGFVRIVFDLLDLPSWWAGMTVLILGGATAVIGILSALMQRELKRMLAFSTVENIGIVFIGLGLAIAFQANGAGAGAALAFTAALLHVFNHSIFKSLLFFGAGAVLSATGERDMEKLGGLIRRMPITAFACLIGCAAISALPPLNGFVSEWMTLQGVLLSTELPQWGLKFTIPAVGAMLALSAALAAACFVKAYGIAFLGRSRSEAADQAAETDPWSHSAMLVCAAICVVAGILPGLLIDALAPVSEQLTGSRMLSQADIPWLSIVPMAASRSSYNGLLVMAFIGISAGFAAFAIHRLASRQVRRGPAWDCGFPDASPATQYTASSFSQPIRRIYGAALFGAKERVFIPPPGDVQPAIHELELRDRIWDTLYQPIIDAIGWAAERLNQLQFLSIRRYLSLVFIALVGLLLVVALWQ